MNWMTRCNISPRGLFRSQQPVKSPLRYPKHWSRIWILSSGILTFTSSRQLDLHLVMQSEVDCEKGAFGPKGSWGFIWHWGGPRFQWPAPVFSNARVAKQQLEVGGWMVYSESPESEALLMWTKWMHPNIWADNALNSGLGLIVICPVNMEHLPNNWCDW